MCGCKSNLVNIIEGKQWELKCFSLREKHIRKRGNNMFMALYFMPSGCGRHFLHLFGRKL